MVNYSCESLYPKYTKQLNGVKYSCEALEAVPGEEGMAGALLKHFLGIPSGDFEYVLITLPEKYKEKLLGQVFCRPAPGYEMPSVPTVFNVDNSKIIPQWPTTKTHDKATGVQIERGLSYDDVVAKWTKFADFMVGISKIDEDAFYNALDASVKIYKENKISKLNHEAEYNYLEAKHSPQQSQNNHDDARFKQILFTYYLNRGNQ